MTKVVEMNCATGVETERDMTDEEEADHTQMVSDYADEVAAREAAFAKQAEDKASGEAKLADLGLSADEIAALVG